MATTPDNLLKTPLNDLHLSLGARMVPFAGYSMPVQYPAGLMAEHLHTRTAAGLFDVSHMGQLRLVGPDAAAFVIEQQAVALLARSQVDHVHRHQALERGRCIGSDQAQLAHVRDVKQAGCGAGVQVLGHQACRVLHRHRVTGKRHHARAQ